MKAGIQLILKLNNLTVFSKSTHELDVSFEKEKSLLMVLKGRKK